MGRSLFKYFSFLSIILSASLIAQNYSLSFDGSGDYVDLPDNISFTSSPGFTVSMWVKSPWADGRRGFIEINNGNGSPNSHTQRYALGCNKSNSDIKFFTEGSDLVPSHTFVNYQPNYDDLADEWVMLTATADFNSYKLYLNGELVAEETNVSPNDFLLSSSGDARIGGDVYGSSINDYTGLMDDVSIWNRALTAEEVASLEYDIQGNESGLIAYWNFDDGDGPVAADLSGNEYDATVIS
ncbi:MAG: LamG domain-containing protein, partial [Candidatus Neomarinimicrobiota bacterium]|nr:LamG domain-containing protein [Candidatus Neomarinimicrobiota bacterium]